MGVRRGAAPVAADRPFMKRSRGTATVARSLVAQEPPSTHPFSATNKSSVSGDARPFLKRQRETAAHGKIAPPPGPKFTKVMQGGIDVKISGGEALPNARSSLKRPRVMERGDEGFAMPCPGLGQLGILRKRMAVEMDALHALLRKAELLFRKKNAAEPRKEEPVEAVSKTMPAAKRRKASPLEECEAGQVPAHEEKGLVDDVHGGVSPVAIRCPSPAVSAKKTQETDNRESRITPEDEDEFVDICSGVSPIAFQETVLLPVEDDGETGSRPSSSSSSSDGETGSSPSSSSSGSESSSSSSESDSDSDEEDNVHSPPAPPVVVPEEKSTAAQSLSELLASVPMQDTELEEIEQLQSDAPKKVQDVQRAAPAPEAVSMPGLIYRAKLRLTLLEIESTVLPDESIHVRELQCLGIAEYGRLSVMRQLGLFLKAN
ncbi:hypothetical protein BS78_04G188700 [Paspalum vaginatum]|nr:hypothetical protein BS78_04G188700 [Paspalum vaginatum]